MALHSISSGPQDVFLRGEALFLARVATRCHIDIRLTDTFSQPLTHPCLLLRETHSFAYSILSECQVEIHEHIRCRQFNAQT